jgi:deoxyribonuclease V
MDHTLSHAWNVTPREAVQLQRDWAPRVELSDRVDAVHLLAGVDVGFEAGGSVTRAAVAVLAFPSLELVESAIERQPTVFPYVPGLLSFREIPALCGALDQLEQSPDLILCDGQGYAHPRRFGLACHLGVLRDVPSIGVGKTRLVGTFDPVPDRRGAWTPLIHKEEVVGAVLRTRRGVKPVFVSPGHRLTLEAAVAWVMASTPRFRLPEAIRHAHRLASNERSAR